MPSNEPSSLENVNEQLLVGLDAASLVQLAAVSSRESTSPFEARPVFSQLFWLIHHVLYEVGLLSNILFGVQRANAYLRNDMVCVHKPYLFLVDSTLIDIALL